ncbi:MAG TPA: hypothetical protein VE781_06650 [Kineosporiaceae bacterium]|nr:hypothetical protein [Kineosporiaceae bacterium]
MARGRWVAAVLGAALSLTACTTGASTSSSSAAPEPSAAATGAATPAPGTGADVPTATTGQAGGPSASGPRASSSVPVRRSSRLQFTVSSRIPVPGHRGLGLVLWDGHAAWVGCGDCRGTVPGGPADVGGLFVADLDTGRVRAVARVPITTSITTVGGVGSDVVYTTSVVGKTGNAWALLATDVATGRTRTLAQAVQRPDTPPPVAVMSDTEVVWQTFPHAPPHARHGPVTALNLSSGNRRVLAADLPGLLTATTSAGILFRAVYPPGGDDTVPLVAGILLPDSDQMRPLSGDDVEDLVSDGKAVAWQTVAGAQAGVWAAQLEDVDNPRLVHKGGTTGRAVGKGFLAVVTAGDFPVLLLYPLAGGPVTAVGDIPVEFAAVAAERRQLAYLALPPNRGQEPDAKHPLTLVVGTVTPPAP